MNDLGLVNNLSEKNGAATKKLAKFFYALKTSFFKNFFLFPVPHHMEKFENLEEERKLSETEA